jgi:hypothetical protein
MTEKQDGLAVHIQADLPPAIEKLRKQLDLETTGQAVRLLIREALRRRGLLEGEP